MTHGIYDWIKTGFDQTSNTRGREDGAVVFADYDNNEITRLNWLRVSSLSTACRPSTQLRRKRRS